MAWARHKGKEGGVALTQGEGRWRGADSPAVPGRLNKVTYRVTVMSDCSAGKLSYRCCCMYSRNLHLLNVKLQQNSVPGLMFL